MIFAQDLQRFIGWGSSIVDKVVDPLLSGDQFLFLTRLFPGTRNQSDDVA
jgi:hypothetical protein